MLVALVSVKGSPGVTTAAVGLAARWPGPGGAVVVEADPAGGDLAARFGLAPDPGLAAMALAARDGSEVDPSGWLRPLRCGVEAVLAPAGSAATASLAAMGEQAGRLVRTLAGGGRAVLVDGGRWQPGSPVEPLLSIADQMLLVVRPLLEDIRQSESRVRELRPHHPGLRLVLVGERGQWPSKEIAAAVGLPLAGVLPVDGRGAGVLAGRLAPRRGWGRDGLGSWTRLPLLRACHSLARQLYAPPVADAPATAPPLEPAPARSLPAYQAPAARPNSKTAVGQ